VVIKVGGHLVCPEGGPDPAYISGLASTLRACARETEAMIVVVGGGTIARRYIEVARALGVGEGGCDALGILVSRVNASLVSAAYWGGVPQPVAETLEDAVRTARAEGVAFMGGLQPGQSTTTVAALAAEALPADLLVIATDVEGVYTSDPRRDPSAKLLRRVSVRELRRMFSRVDRAGGYKLLDPYTLDILERSRIRARVVCGSPPSNILAAVRGEDVGTLVEPAKPF